MHSWLALSDPLFALSPSSQVYFLRSFCPNYFETDPTGIIIYAIAYAYYFPAFFVYNGRKFHNDACRVHCCDNNGLCCSA